MISLDTEASGLDLRHGAKPFLVTVCNEEGENIWWEWTVDPMTRQPKIPEEDLDEVFKYITDNRPCVLQNAKFDVAALNAVGEFRWDWRRTYDTLLAGHLLASNHPHDLASMALEYLGVNILPYEDAMRQASNEARRIARSKYPDWKIASKNLPEMPSLKSSPWKNDMWLPRAVAQEEGYPSDHPWWTVCSEYANADSATTLALFRRQKELLQKRGLWNIYLERLKVLPIVYAMEERGITLNRERLEELQTSYIEESAEAGQVCTNIAASFNYDLSLPKSGNNKSLLTFLFGTLDDNRRLFGNDAPMPLPIIKKSKKTGKPSLDAEVLGHYEATLPQHSKQLTFIRSLRDKRQRDTAVSYLDGYTRFWLPLPGQAAKWQNGVPTNASPWRVLHPSLNPTGTHTLRWSSSNPNEQNISSRENFNLRYCFGPAPGREWYSLDYDNIELRIPAYESEEQAMVDIFERPDDPPYYGSYHLLICHLLHPEKFDECIRDGVSFKDRYKTTWYQWVKNFDFADQYGAVEVSGTADKAAHVPGAQRLVNGRLKEKSKLNQKWIDFANKHGYVETLPDKTVDPNRGYPILCSRSKWGGILPTIPLNYHVQSTACWCIMKAMSRVYDYLRGLPDHYLIIQIHDEIVVDFPRGRSPLSRYKNLYKVRKIQKLMEQSGGDIGVPLTVSVTFHPENWSEGVEV